MQRGHLGVVIVTLVAVAVLVGTAAGHSGYATSTPKDGAVLLQSPRQVTVRFDRELDARASRFVLAGPLARKPAARNRIVGRIDLDDLDRTLLRARIKTKLPVGVYLVTWRAVDAVDGDATTGSFRFRVKRR